MNKFIQRMVDFIQSRFDESLSTGIILGSGLGHIGEKIQEAVRIPYSEIPGYPKPTVEGHAGELILGHLSGRTIVMASGRFHLYEGWDMNTVTLPVKIFHNLGVQNLIITNSAGSIREQNGPGTLMAIEANLDFTFRESSSPPSIVRSDNYHSREFLKLAAEQADCCGINLRRGVYAWTLGPSYETPAEIEMIKALGGDVVGMSTIPEIRAAAKLGMKILTISCLTNYAAGVSKNSIKHEDVIAVAAEVSEKFSMLLELIVSKISEIE